tara:strand:- start:115 stop:408 length:294 start_codon:yes stop_codon:yes gene_type:complete
MWEFLFESQGVENFTRGISNLELIGVFIKFEHLENFCNDIKVTSDSGNFFQLRDALITNISLCKDTIGPFEQSLEDSFVLSLLGGFLSREGVWSFNG